MVKPVTRVLLKSISSLPATRLNRVSSSSVCHNGLKYSTSTSGPDGPESHQDLKNVAEKDIKDNSVMIYIKGVPDMPRCGFSSLAVRVLKVYDVPFGARNILENPELKNAVKSVRLKEFIVAFASISHLHPWTCQLANFSPNIHHGRIYRGSDIILNMHQTGELKQKQDVAAGQEESEVNK